MASKTAYLLVSHGSRDARPQAAMDRLAQFVREYLQHQTLERQYLERQYLASSAPQQAHYGDSSPTPYFPKMAQPVERQPIRGQQVLGQRQQLSVLAAPRAASRAASRAEAKAVSMGQAETVNSQLRSPSPLPFLAPMMGPMVGTACLERGHCSLEQQIYEFGQRAKAAGASIVKLIPLFLLQGVHVMEDLPRAVAQAHQRLKAMMAVELCPHVGSHPALQHLLAARLSGVTSGASLLVAHGSRRKGGNKPVDAIARCLQATVAYWSVPPDMESQVIELMQQGHQQIAILPYFLFMGGITDAVTHLTEELAERFPQINFRLLPPIGASRDLARLVIDLAD